MEIPIAYPVMGGFEKVLEESRDFFSSQEEEREVVDLIRRDPEAILSGDHRPFMKKLASAMIKDHPKDQARFQQVIDSLETKIISLEADLREHILRVEEKSNVEWEEGYAKYPDPCDTSIPMAVVEKAANAGIADAQYYLYFMLSQCIFDRFWHIKVKWLRKAAEQGHVEAIKRYAREHALSKHTGNGAMKEDMYWKYKLVEIGEIPEVEFLEQYWNQGIHDHSSVDTLKGYSMGDDLYIFRVQEIVSRLKRLMARYGEGSPGYERCKRVIQQTQGPRKSK
jgi:hypothetical protein